MRDKLFKLMFFGCLFVIEYLATTTRHIEIIENLWDKANHFVAFMTLYILLSLAYKFLKTIYKIVLLLLYGIQIEIVQSFIPGRFFSLLDVVADSIGIVIGIGLWWIYQKKFTKVFS